MTAEAGVSCNGLMRVVSKRHGKYYASLVALNGKTAVNIAIVGPFATEREADELADKGVRANQLRTQRGEPILLPDSGDKVPPAVRLYIGRCIAEELAQHGTSGDNIFGMPLS
jgi:hypothetical protein